jgi:hypothetical protein
MKEIGVMTYNLQQGIYGMRVMTVMEFERVTTLFKSLSRLEKVELIEQLTAMLKEEIAEEQPKQPRRSLAGLWEGVSVSAEDIDEARREMMKNFPREDIG